MPLSMGLLPTCAFSLVINDNQFQIEEDLLSKKRLQPSKATNRAPKLSFQAHVCCWERVPNQSSGYEQNGLLSVWVTLIQGRNHSCNHINHHPLGLNGLLKNTFYEEDRLTGGGRTCDQTFRRTHRFSNVAIKRFSVGRSHLDAIWTLVFRVQNKMALNFEWYAEKWIALESYTQSKLKKF